ncbi:EEF1A lysine methyltransferase 2-like [Watersipora subatra]|uniref:EEF1A lysine methyltransferase 2-like n=1 Tax=Watersipora subatra TaxID=2589382 RepID=UPI00355C693D
MLSAMACSELDPSELGTKHHWDEFYKTELTNYHDHEETGEVWFGMASVRRMVEWVKRMLPDRSSSILDIGCGNGMLLLKLAEAEYTQLTGVDYSQPAIDLAVSLAKDKAINYEVANILLSDSSPIFSQKFCLAMDKGTYDAISLTPETAQPDRLNYITNVHRLLTSGGFFFITSCNWTSHELQSHFVFSGKFIFVEDIPAPTFKFGGATGQTESYVVFQAV